MHPDLTVKCHPKWLWKFNALLQQGVQVGCMANRTLLALLKKDLNLSSRYISHRIQTITLDGHPVDDPACAVVPDGATLAISGAMPGLVGATLRKGGYYAAMRGTISHCTNPKPAQKIRAGLITVKLFNLVLRDLAATFLSHGIGVAGKDLVPVLDDSPASSHEQFVLISHSGEVLGWPEEREHYLGKALLFVVVVPNLSAGHWREDTETVPSPQ